MKSSHLLCALLGLALLTGVRIISLQPGSENSQDVFYHVELADMSPATYMSGTFPPLTMSCWRDKFSDKELSFHILLSIVRRLKRFLGISNPPPFNIEFAISAGLFIFAFAFVLSSFGIERPCLFVFGLFALSPFLLTRLVMLRPHLPAMAIVVASCALFRFVTWRRLWVPAALGFAMAWTYSNPHFILLPAALLSIAHLKDDWRLFPAVPLATAAGILIGYTLHPQFPSTFVNWKIQCVDVVWESISGTTALGLGSELCPGDRAYLLRQGALVVASTANAVWTIAAMTAIFRNGDGKFSLANYSKDDIFAVGLTSTSVAATIGMLFAIRAVEYAVPFTLLAIAFNLKHRPPLKLKILESPPHKLIIISIYLIVTVLAMRNVSDYIPKARRSSVKPPLEFAAWLERSGIPPGAVIGNVNWSDFPLLFYAAPKYRYLAGIDPMFAYAAHPERMKALELFRMGRKALTPERLYQAAGTRFIFVSAKNRRLAVDMYKMGFVAVYQGGDGDLFDLVATYRHHHKKQTLSGENNGKQHIR